MSAACTPEQVAAHLGDASLGETERLANVHTWQERRALWFGGGIGEAAIDAIELVQPAVTAKNIGSTQGMVGIQAVESEMVGRSPTDIVSNEQGLPFNQCDVGADGDFARRHRTQIVPERSVGVRVGGQGIEREDDPRIVAQRKDVGQRTPYACHRASDLPSQQGCRCNLPE